MKLPVNPFNCALKDRQKQVGLWASLSNNYAAEVIATAGYDWVLLDMEHSPNSIGGVLGQLEVMASTATTAIVRPPWNDPVMVKRLLDIGAPGLLFPMIQSVEEAEKAVASTRYPPRGIRGVSNATRANAFGRIILHASKKRRRYWYRSKPALHWSVPLISPQWMVLRACFSGQRTSARISVNWASRWPAKSGN